MNKILKLAEKFEKLALRRSPVVIEMQRALHEIVKMYRGMVAPAKFKGQNKVGVPISHIAQTSDDGLWGNLTNRSLDTFNKFQQKAVQNEIFKNTEPVTLGQLGLNGLVENPDELAKENLQKLSLYLSAMHTLNRQLDREYGPRK